MEHSLCEFYPFLPLSPASITAGPRNAVQDRCVFFRPIGAFMLQFSQGIRPGCILAPLRGYCSCAFFVHSLGEHAKSLPM